MNTFQLSCFLAVAEYLSFSQAAQQLHVTHPAVSQQIRSLEKELNVKLFQRSTRSVKLTHEGKAFLRDAQQIVALSERAKRRFSGAGEGHIETLSVGCYNFPCLFLLSDTLEMLREVRPNLHPHLQTVPFRHIYRLLEEGDLDVVVGFQELPGIKVRAVYREIAKVPVVCVCPGNHPLAARRELTLAELTGEPLVLFIPPNATPSVVRLQGQLMEDRPPSAFYFCESAEAITVLVTAGYGISLLPDYLVPETPLLARIPLRDVPPLSFGMYYRSVQQNDALKDFLRCAAEAFAQE